MGLSVPKYRSDCRIWALKLYYLGTWTLREQVQGLGFIGVVPNWPFVDLNQEAVVYRTRFHVGLLTLRGGAPSYRTNIECPITRNYGIYGYSILN